MSVKQKRWGLPRRSKKAQSQSHTSACTDGKGEHARHTHDGDRQSNSGKSAERNWVEPIGGEHFGAHVCERSGALEGLIVTKIIFRGSVPRGYRPKIKIIHPLVVVGRQRFL